MTRVQKDYCVNNLTALIVNTLSKEIPEGNNIEIAADFMSSHTYELLVDHKTRLWAEGPDYIIEWYKEEKNRK